MTDRDPSPPPWQPPADGPQPITFGALVRALVRPPFLWLTLVMLALNVYTVIYSDVWSFLFGVIALGIWVQVVYKTLNAHSDDAWRTAKGEPSRLPERVAGRDLLANMFSPPLLWLLIIGIVVCCIAAVNLPVVGDLTFPALGGWLTVAARKRVLRRRHQ